jgi:hypothetical protein
MEPDNAKALTFWAKVMLITLAVDLILLAVDHKLKNDVIRESKALREEVSRVRYFRGGAAGPAAEDDPGVPGAGDDGVVPVVDDPGAPASAVADEGAGGAARVDGERRPPSRGGVNAG